MNFTADCRIIRLRQNRGAKRKRRRGQQEQAFHE